MSAYSHHQLPSPVYLRGGGPGSDWQSFLLQRSRTTNLAVLLLGSVCVLSLLGNISSWMSGVSYLASSYKTLKKLIELAAGHVRAILDRPDRSDAGGTDDGSDAPHCRSMSLGMVGDRRILGGR